MGLKFKSPPSHSHTTLPSSYLTLSLSVGLSHSALLPSSFKHEQRHLLHSVGCSLSCLRTNKETWSDRAIRQWQQNTRRVFSLLFVSLKQMKPAGALAYIRRQLVSDNALIWREIDPGPWLCDRISYSCHNACQTLLEQERGRKVKIRIKLALW